MSTHRKHNRHHKRDNYNNNMLFSLDIGSSKIVGLVASITEDDFVVHGLSCHYLTNNSKTNELAYVQNGAICNFDAIGNIVNQVLAEARIEADCSTGSVLVNIAGGKVCSLYTSAAATLEPPVVSAQIMHRLIDDARLKKNTRDYEILDYEVQEYLLDNEYYAINPIHLSANHIKSNLNLFLSKSSQATNLRKVLRYSGFATSRLVPSGILAGMSILNSEEKELGCCLLDIGAGTTDIVVYENGFIRHLASIPLAGENITRDIAAVLKISRNLAEDLKLSHGGCSYTSNNHRISEGISIVDHRGVSVTIGHKLLIDIITVRVREIFEIIKTVLINNKLYDIISSGIVLTGGSSLLPNIDELAKSCFAELPIKLGVPDYKGEFADIVNNPKYATSLGAFQFARAYMLQNDEITGGKFTAKDGGVHRLISLVKHFFR